MCKECLNYTGNGKEYVQANFGYASLQSNFNINYSTLNSSQAQSAARISPNYRQQYSVFKYN